MMRTHSEAMRMSLVRCWRHSNRGDAEFRFCAGSRRGGGAGKLWDGFVDRQLFAAQLGQRDLPDHFGEAVAIKRSNDENQDDRNWKDDGHEEPEVSICEAPVKSDEDNWDE